MQGGPSYTYLPRVTEALDALNAPAEPAEKEELIADNACVLDSSDLALKGNLDNSEKSF